jgi:hypothetical protein
MHLVSSTCASVGQHTAASMHHYPRPSSCQRAAHAACNVLQQSGRRPPTWLPLSSRVMSCGRRSSTAGRRLSWLYLRRTTRRYDSWSKSSGRSVRELLRAAARAAVSSRCGPLGKCCVHAAGVSEAGAAAVRHQHLGALVSLQQIRHVAATSRICGSQGGLVHGTKPHC